MKRVIAENLTKRYQLATQEKKTMNFRELFSSQVTSFFKKNQDSTTFDALKNVSFEVEEGEILGIIGKNGSGKSTLLKILSSIILPTSGKAILRGRIASLLEVGTGFHGELTGRENIYLSGIILGMKRWEITQHFNEITTFSGVEQFLDVPVKKYSSGMRLRLAFSVAAHLRPEILLMDEVLSVGDYEFEKKCLDTVDTLSKSGRTILFVSHNLPSVTKLCSRVMVLDQGVQKYIGNPLEALNLYLGGDAFLESSVTWDNNGLILDSTLSLFSFKAVDTQGLHQESFELDEKVCIEFSYKVIDVKKNLLAVLFFYDAAATLLFSASYVLNTRNDSVIKSIECLLCNIPENIFEEGVITVGLTIFNKGNEGKMLDFEDMVLFMEKNLIRFSMKFEKRKKFIWDETFWQTQKGKIRPLVTWEQKI